MFFCIYSVEDHTCVKQKATHGQMGCVLLLIGISFLLMFVSDTATGASVHDKTAVYVVF